MVKTCPLTNQAFLFCVCVRVCVCGAGGLGWCRPSETLNVRGEKVNEALFLSALKKAVMQWPGTKLVDYCCAESGILGNDDTLRDDKMIAVHLH